MQGNILRRGRRWGRRGDLTPPIWRGISEQGLSLGLGGHPGRRNSNSEDSEGRGRAACGVEGRGVSSWPGAAVTGDCCFYPPEVGLWYVQEPWCGSLPSLAIHPRRRARTPVWAPAQGPGASALTVFLLGSLRALTEGGELSGRPCLWPRPQHPPQTPYSPVCLAATAAATPTAS